MAAQSRERSEYLIMEKGYAVIKGIAEIYSTLISHESLQSGLDAGGSKL
jgi:hypothetical protein